MRRISVTPKGSLLALFFVLLIGYSLFQARFIILGPHIAIQTPQNGAHLSDHMVVVSGRAENISFLSLNDRPIYVDEKGLWSEKLIAPEGLSIMTVRAKDRFGRTTEKQVEIMVN